MPRRVGLLRMGRLGDLVMTLPAVAWLQGRPDLHCTLITDARWQPLLPEWRTAAVDPGPGPQDAWLDLHRVPASRAALRRLRGASGAPVERVQKEDLRRRSLLFGSAWAPRWTWPERHLLAAERLMRRLGLDPGERPAPLPRLDASTPPQPGLLGLVPGAAHATKRWPLARWVALAQRWRDEGGAVRAFTAPDEAHLLEPLRAVGVEPWPTPLGRLREGLAACAVVVAGDTGPLHVAGALGRPVVALFGPTPPEAGFWIWGANGTALRPALSCAPCSLHGGDRCPRRHHRCLEDLAVETVLSAARALR